MYKIIVWFPYTIRAPFIHDKIRFKRDNVLSFPKIAIISATAGPSCKMEWERFIFFVNRYIETRRFLLPPIH